MDATKVRIEELYNDDEHFENFLNVLKSEIETTELLLLMNEISEKLNIRIQRKLWEVLRL